MSTTRSARLPHDLTETMRAAPGIGITAPHIGILRRLVVIQLETDPEPHIYIDPDIVWASADTIRHVEGSVSMPGVTDELERRRKSGCATGHSTVRCARRRRRA